MPLALRAFIKLGQILILSALWLVAIPLILGLIFEVMLIVPIRVPLNETAFVSPLEAWALGLVFLKIWLRCVFLGVWGPDNIWKRRFDRVRANGFRDLDFKWTLREVVLPVGVTLGDLLFTPHFIVKTTEIVVAHPWCRTVLLQALSLYCPRGWCSPPDECIDMILSVMKRSAWLVYLAAILVLRAHSLMGRALKRLHDRIRDDQYLVGLELKNLHHPEPSE